MMIHCPGFNGSLSTLNGNEPEPWNNGYADIGRVILADESAGGTTAHYAARVAGVPITRLQIVHRVHLAPTKSAAASQISAGRIGFRAVQWTAKSTPKSFWCTSIYPKTAIYA